MKNYKGPTCYNTFIECGTEIFYLMNHEMIIKAKVIETDNVWTKEGNDKSVWSFHYLNHDDDYVAISNGERNEQGWEMNNSTKDFTVLEGYKQCSQFLWIDEPTGGHEIYLGEDCFLTLNEAMKHIRPSRRKHLKRKLNKIRSVDKRFIARTWEPEIHPGFDPYPMKRVYVKRK
jgi:hypothetical protein